MIKKEIRKRGKENKLLTSLQSTHMIASTKCVSKEVLDICTFCGITFVGGIQNQHINQITIAVFLSQAECRTQIKSLLALAKNLISQLWI
jgi:hypothetical protein